MKGASVMWKASLLAAATAVLLTAPAFGVRAQVGAQNLQSNLAAAPVKTESDAPYFTAIYRNFYDTYQLGPEDEIAVRIVGQPEYSLENARVSPVGRIFHPLLGDVEVVGLTINRVNQKLTADLSDYIINPKVSVALITANSAKIGVLGDVARPGIVVMARPMTVLEAISAAGGITDHGSKSNVGILRQLGDGRFTTMKVNLKTVLEGKASSEDNLMLRAGDTVIVHGNLKKKISFITSLVGFGHFLTLLAR